MYSTARFLWANLADDRLGEGGGVEITSRRNERTPAVYWITWHDFVIFRGAAAFERIYIDGLVYCGNE